MATFDAGAALAAGHSATDIVNEVGSKVGFNVNGARSAGHSDGEILSELASKGAVSLPSPAQSYGSDLQAGAHGAMTGLGATATDLGNTAEQTIGAGNISSGLQTAGKFLAGHAPDMPANYAAPDVGGAIQRGDYAAIPGQLAHAAVAAAPDMAATLGAGALAGPIGAGAYQAARNLGPTADARAAANNHATATPGDVLGALPSTAVDAVAGAYMPGGAAGKIANPILRAGAKVGIDAAAGGAIDQANQIGGSAGTTQGVKDDPYQSAGAALGAGAARAGSLVPETVGQSVIKPVSDHIMARTLDEPASPSDAQSVLRVNNAMDAARSSAVNSRGSAMPDTTIANTVKAEYVTNLNGLAGDLFKAGLLNASEKSDLLAAINNQALRQNNTITEGLPGVQSLFDKIGDLNLPEEAKTALSNGVRDLNTVSSNSFIKNTTGPMQRIGNLAGQATSVIGGAMSGNPLEVVGGIMGHGIAGKIGGAIGAGADRMLGTNTPPVVLQKINAMRVLKQAGVDPDTASGLQALQNVRGGLQDVSSVTGSPKDPIPVNTPVRGAPEASVSSLPPLRVDTADTVRAAMAADDNTPATPPVEAPQRLQDAQATLQAPQAPQPAQTPSRAPWRAYVANGDPNITDAHISSGLGALTATGLIDPKEAAHLEQHQGGYTASRLQQIQQAAQAAAYGAAQGTPQGANQGYAVEHSVQARTNAQTYQTAAIAHAQMNPAHASAILDVAVGHKSPATKRAAAAAYISAHPDAAGAFPDWLLNHGRKD